MSTALLKNGVLVFTGGGIKGNLPHMPGQGSLPKRLRGGAGVSLELAGKRLTQEAGIAATQTRRNGFEAVYAGAHEAAGTQRLRRKYRRP